MDAAGGEAWDIGRAVKILLASPVQDGLGRSRKGLFFLLFVFWWRRFETIEKLRADYLINKRNMDFFFLTDDDC